MGICPISTGSGTPIVYHDQLQKITTLINSNDKLRMLVLKAFLSIAFPGRNKDDILKRLIDAVAKHEASHHKRWLQLVKKNSADPKNLSLELLKKIIKDRYANYDLDEALAGLGELKEGLKEGNFWVSLMTLYSEQGNDMILNLLSDDIKTTDIFKNIEIELTKPNPSPKELKDFLEGGFTRSDVQWGELLEKHAKGNSQTEAIAERVHKYYDILYKVWDKLNQWETPEADRAMNIQNKELGGIDLTSDKAIQIENDDGAGIKFEMDAAMLQRLQKAKGFEAVIHTLEPMTDLRKFLMTASYR